MPAKAVGQAAQMLNVPAPSRASPLPQGISAWIGICASPQNTVGAWLARESGGPGSTGVECADAFASKLAPTGSGGVHSNRAHHKITVGACLQAIAVGQAAQMLNVPTPSRASPLPQGISVWIGICASPQNTVGAWLAREGGGLGSTDVECADAFASKPAPTRDLGMDRGMCLTTKHCGSVACPRKRWIWQHRC